MAGEQKANCFCIDYDEQMRLQRLLRLRPRRRLLLTGNAHACHCDDYECDHCDNYCYFAPPTPTTTATAATDYCYDYD